MRFPSPFQLALARFDADGEPIWNRNHDVRPGLVLHTATHLLRVVDSEGQPAYLVIGTGNVTTLSAAVPVFSKAKGHALNHNHLACKTTVNARPVVENSRPTGATRTDSPSAPGRAASDSVARFSKGFAG